jgi:hypothetical protein
MHGHGNKKVGFFFPSFQAEPQSKDETLKIKWQYSSSKQRLPRSKKWKDVDLALV